MFLQEAQQAHMYTIRQAIVLALVLLLVVQDYYTERSCQNRALAALGFFEVFFQKQSDMVVMSVCLFMSYFALEFLLKSFGWPESAVGFIGPSSVLLAVIFATFRIEKLIYL